MATEYFATFDELGNPLGYWNKDIYPDRKAYVPAEMIVRNPAIPRDAVGITEAQWLEFINNSGQRRWSGTDVVSYQPPVEEPEVLQVSAAQAQTALYNAGLLEKAEEMALNHPYRPVRIFYEKANTWEKMNPYLQAFAVELGLIVYSPEGEEDATGLNNLFTSAGKL